MSNIQKYMPSDLVTNMDVTFRCNSSLLQQIKATDFDPFRFLYLMGPICMCQDKPHFSMMRGLSSFIVGKVSHFSELCYLFFLSAKLGGMCFVYYWKFLTFHQCFEMLWLSAGHVFACESCGCTKSLTTHHPTPNVHNSTQLNSTQLYNYIFQNLGASRVH
jgi:hypothetical protein